jgi:hypothetical protein
MGLELCFAVVSPLKMKKSNSNVCFCISVLILMVEAGGRRLKSF